MCRSTMRRRRGAKCVEVLCVEGGGATKCVEDTMRRRGGGGGGRNV